MKKHLFLLFLITLISSCASIRLTGVYPISGVSKETTLNYEDVWNRVIDFFSTLGIPITTLDKSSGLIVTSGFSFVNDYTREERGKPLNEEAYVVIPTIRKGFGSIIEPNSTFPKTDWTIMGDFNVRVKIDGQKTIVNVNVVNLKCFYSTPGIYGSGHTNHVPIKSTGVFESFLLDYLTE